VAAEAPHGTVVARHTDVTNWDSVAATVAFARGEMGGSVDVLVNCAGWTIDRLFMEKPRSEWEREIAIDTWGFINSVRAVLDPMIERGYGRIVSIGSDAGRIGEWREAVYSGTKASVIAMSKALARAVGKYGITLNVGCPGLIPGSPETSGRESVWACAQSQVFTPDAREKAAHAYPLPPPGGPTLASARPRSSGTAPLWVARVDRCSAKSYDSALAAISSRKRRRLSGRSR